MPGCTISQNKGEKPSQTFLQPYDLSRFRDAFGLPVAWAKQQALICGVYLWYASALAISWPIDAMEREAARSLQRAGPGMMEMREAMAMSLVVALPDQRQARR